MRDWVAWMKCACVGHLWCYDHHGPPVQDWGGPWYVCVRCNAWGRARNPLIPQ